MGGAYWERRKDFLYYQVVRILAEELAQGAGSVLDVGSRGTPYLEWFEDVPVRTSLDLVVPYTAEGITSITGDFLTWTPDRRYDLVMCLQVLEHVPDAKAFAHKLLASGRIVIISVPYRWRPGGHERHHIHDPIDVRKLQGWFGRKPNHAYLVREPRRGTERLVCVYEEGTRVWMSLDQRAGRPHFRPAKGIPPFLERPLTIRQSSRALATGVRRRLGALRRRGRG